MSAISKVQHSMQVFSSLRLRKPRHQQRLPKQLKGQQLPQLQRRRLQRVGPPFRLLLGCWDLEVIPDLLNAWILVRLAKNPIPKLLHLLLRAGIVLNAARKRESRPCPCAQGEHPCCRYLSI